MTISIVWTEEMETELRRHIWGGSSRKLVETFVPFIAKQVAEDFAKLAEKYGDHDIADSVRNNYGLNSGKPEPTP